MTKARSPRMGERAFVTHCINAQALGFLPWFAALPLRERRLRARLLMRSSRHLADGAVPRRGSDWQPRHSATARGRTRAAPVVLPAARGGGGLSRDMGKEFTMIR